MRTPILPLKWPNSGQWVAFKITLESKNAYILVQKLNSCGLTTLVIRLTLSRLTLKYIAKEKKCFLDASTSFVHVEEWMIFIQVLYAILLILYPHL